jgi:hypothetical protein
VSLTIREENSRETVLKIVNIMLYIATLKTKILIFAFVRHCLSRNHTQIDLNRVINYLTRKFKKNRGKKLNVECNIAENFKDDQGFSTVFPAILIRFKRGPNF